MSAPPPATQDNDDASLPALFWDTMPEDPESHPDYAALKAIDDDLTPDERAHNFKTQGNNKLRIGIKAGNKVLFREATDYYTKGLAAGCTDTALIGVLYANRAQVELMLGNWRKALNDSKEAIRISPSNVKAYFRGAKAAVELKEFDQAQQLCEEGLKVDSSAKELADLLQAVRTREAKARKQQQEAERQLDARLAPARRLAAAISTAGYRMTQAQFRAGHLRPSIDSEGMLHWPVLLIYAENMQQDVIEDFEVATPFAAHLDVMFADDAPPLEWDTDREYTRDRVELYYLTHAGNQLTQDEVVDALAGEATAEPVTQPELPKRYGNKAAAWVKVPEEATLHEILTKPDFLIPGVPVFFVVAAGTDYRRRFLAHNK